MLSGRKPGQRAAVRRRPLLLLAILTAAVAVVLAAAADLPRLEAFDLATARAVCRRARHSLTPEDSPARRRVDALLAQAEEVSERERSASRWRRDEEALEAAWSRVMTALYEAHLELREERRQVTSRWAALEPEAAAAVARARREARAAGLGRREIQLAQQAEVALGSARRLAEVGELAAALRKGDTALAQADEVHARWLALHRRFEDGASLAHWRRLVEEAVAESRRSGTTALVVDKLRRRMEVYAGGRRVATFRVELGGQGLKRKLHAGDRATPEGRYRVVQVKTGRQTRYYKALLLDYPNAEDRARYERERRQGNVPRGVGMGSLIEIHGDGGQGRDWTDGCIALTNEEMDRLFRYAGLRTPVVIVGTVPDGEVAR